MTDCVVVCWGIDVTSFYDIFVFIDLKSTRKLKKIKKNARNVKKFLSDFEKGAILWVLLECDSHRRYIIGMFMACYRHIYIILFLK